MPTNNQHINALRARQQRNFLATLLLSQGVPMLTAGDELGRTQLGNNNAYCQDSELTWIDWSLSKENRQLLRFVQKLIRLRKKHPAFRRRYFFQGRDIFGVGVKDITWLSPGGGEMSDKEWHQPFGRCLGLFLAGDAIGEHDERGRKISDVNFILLFNSHHEDIAFTLPAEPLLARWEVLVDTGAADGESMSRRLFHANQKFPLQRRSFVLMKQLISPPLRAAVPQE